MKRWGIVLVLVLVLVVVAWLLVREHHAKSKAADVPQRVTESKSPDRLPGRALRPPNVLSSLPVAGASALSEDHWKQKARDFRERWMNLKPERVGEIEAVAPRLHLLPKDVQTLSRWSDTAADLETGMLTGVENQAQYDAAMKRAVLVTQAHSKAEKRLLGGLDAWNNYYGMKGASMTGHLDDVDDTGMWKWVPKDRAPTAEELRVKAFHSGPAPNIDTSEFDHYFEE